MLPQWIGPFQFVLLEGIPLLPAEEVMPLVHPGVPGAGMMRLGSRGEGFSLRSKVDAPTFVDAQSLVVQYRSLQGAAPVGITWNGIPQPGLFFVLHVQPVACKAIVGAVGGLNAISAAWVEAEWRLVACSF